MFATFPTITFLQNGKQSARGIYHPNGLRNNIQAGTQTEI